MLERNIAEETARSGHAPVGGPRVERGVGRVARIGDASTMRTAVHAAVALAGADSIGAIGVTRLSASVRHVGHESSSAGAC